MRNYASVTILILDQKHRITLKCVRQPHCECREENEKNGEKNDRDDEPRWAQHEAVPLGTRVLKVSHSGRISTPTELLGQSPDARRAPRRCLCVAANITT